MEDLTVIFLTINRLPEKWVRFQKFTLMEAIDDTPLITISRLPLNWGHNFIQDKISYSNIYRQMLRGAKYAKTKYVAIAEDDTLYPAEHFKFRPQNFGYNMNRWALFNWGRPRYSWKLRVANSALIAKREVLIEALEERFAKYPNGMPENLVGEIGRENIEKSLGVKIQKYEEFWTFDPIVCMNHGWGLDHLGKTKRKGYGFLQAYDIPVWGSAREVSERMK